MAGVSDLEHALRRAGLAAQRRQGKWVYYRLGDESAARAVVKAVFSALDGDAQVTEDRSIAELLRAQSARAACASPPPDRPGRAARRAPAGTVAR